VAFRVKRAQIFTDVMQMYVMAMERALPGFIEGEIAPAGTLEVLNSLSCDSREEVDQLVTKALEAGGRPWKPTNDLGHKYGGSFQDPDGHVSEVVWMDPAALTGGATEQAGTA
jgi:predicted lactoylglutathione lyase